ncbi:MAG: acyltransferase family protein [Ruminococcus sp.]|nr:acyltransferase family protein [Ruminococcus sp.]
MRNVKSPTAQVKAVPKRNVNMDIIRIIALFFVPSVHFFLHNGFYSQTVDNPRMVVMTFMRNLFLLCIPLFLLLTGYLQGNKAFEPNKKYYLKILKVIVPFLIIMTFDLIYIVNALGWEYGVKEYVHNYTSFTHYSWYVEMYIGLFMLIPFLNLIWLNLKSKKQERALVITMFILMIAPSFFNYYQFDAENIMACTSDEYWSIFPNWWAGVYPLAYYFTGAYLAKNKADFKLKPIFAFLIFLGTWAVFGTYTVLRCYGGKASVHGWLGYNSWGLYFMGVALFIFVNSINFKAVPNFVSKALAKLSDLSFGAYLASWMLDQYMYSKVLNVKIPVMEDRLVWYIPCVLLAVTVAYFISFIADLFYKAGSIIASGIAQAIRKAKNS